MTVAERIKARRTELGLSVYDLAERCELVPTLIYRYEKGEVDNLSTGSIMKLAKGLNTTPADLMGWTTPDPCVRIPVYPSLPADVSKLNEGTVIGTVKVDEGLTKHGDVVGLRIYGDYMAPYLSDGDIAVIRITDDLANNDIAAVAYDDFDTTLCRVSLATSGITLKFFDPNLEPAFFTWQDSGERRFRIVGKCLDIKLK